jgi:para-nitrobenzyl esterase
MTSQSTVERLGGTAGRFVVLKERGVVRARGIRYATAARFERPTPVDPEDGEVRAVEPAPACPQPLSRGDRMLGEPYRGIRFDEDCLRLSVTAPDGATAEDRLPVLVWIHGGSYVAGAGDLPIFDPAALVQEQQVIVVAVTFRLGVLGFLGEDDTDGDAVPPNLGLLDLIEALRWVRRHIAGFGGDPEAVTLFGQSAGGDAVAHLMAASGAEGLFRRAIIQSAPFGIRLRRGRMTRRMLDAVGRLDPEATEDLLFAAHDRAYAAARPFGLRSGMPFGPQYGFDPLPLESQVDAAWRAVADRIDVLVGWTAAETSFFAALSPGLRRLFGLPVVGGYARRLLVGATSDAVYRRGGRTFAALLRSAGGRVTEYELDWRPPGGPAPAGHTTDLPLLFPDADAWAGAPLLGRLDPADLLPLGEGMRAVWGAFARGEALPRVPPGPVRLTLR